MRRLTKMLVNRANAVETSATPMAMSAMAKTCMAGVLGREGVVAVADRGHGLDREVGRRQESQMAVGVGTRVGEAKDDRGEER